MKQNWIIAVVVAGSLLSCQPSSTTHETAMEETTDDFQWEVEQFEDLRVLRYQVPGFDQLTARQRMLTYHLTEAGLAGRDIIYATNYRHNLEIRSLLDQIIAKYDGDRENSNFEALHTYAKRVWFANGIHHHYSNQKFEPGFSEEYFLQVLGQMNLSISDEAKRAIFDSSFDAKKVSKDPDSDLLLSSAVNFYDPDVTEEEVIRFYKTMSYGPDSDRPLSLGLNSKIVRMPDGSIGESVYRVGGLYGKAIEQVVIHLEKAIQYAENQAQADALKLLIEYYQTGDLAKWDEYNVAWVSATEGDIDYINGFVEVYNDPKSFRGSYETIVQIKDFEASERMAVVSASAQWFEDNSPIMAEHKKDTVKGITYRIVNVVGESGDASPSTPIGVNLPNANWIRAEHGSKSVSLGNIENAYEKATGEGFLNEFAFTAEERERSIEYGETGSKLHTALHEVIGHASGKLNPGVATPKETLMNYSSTLEEARADLVALYYILDPYLIELGLVENDGPGKAEYDSYIRNGLMLQLRRLKPGENLEEDHMRNRQLVAGWAYERGMEENVIEQKVVDGKTYFVINDYNRLRELWGELLREIQRIKSEGDYEAGRNLVETYGVRVDRELHAEVLRRSEALNIAPYSGFVNPILVPVMENGEMVDVKLEFATGFTEQMLQYAEEYSHLVD